AEPRRVTVCVGEAPRGGAGPAGLAAVRGDRGDGQLGELPPVELADLGGGHLQLLAESAEQPADHLPLGLERSGVRQVQHDTGDADRHVAGHHDLFLTIYRYYS